jgi:hypothetical protein
MGIMVARVAMPQGHRPGSARVIAVAVAVATWKRGTRRFRAGFQ